MESQQLPEPSGVGKLGRESGDTFTRLRQSGGRFTARGEELRILTLTYLTFHLTFHLTLPASNNSSLSRTPVPYTFQPRSKEGKGWVGMAREGKGREKVTVIRTTLPDLTGPYQSLHRHSFRFIHRYYYRSNNIHCSYQPSPSHSRSRSRSRSLLISNRLLHNVLPYLCPPVKHLMACCSLIAELSTAI